MKKVLAFFIFIVYNDYRAVRKENKIRAFSSVGRAPDS